MTIGGNHNLTRHIVANHNIVFIEYYHGLVHDISLASAAAYQAMVGYSYLDFAKKYDW